MTDIRETHPRPQFARADWTDLTGAWGFAHDDEDRGRDERWAELTTPFDRTITVPFPPESAASGVNDPSPHPVVWYRREATVDAGALKVGKRVMLHFGAIDYVADVWVNGQHVAHHEGGHTPFATDITPALRGEANAVIVVRAEDDPFDLSQPRGKQDWQTPSHGIWYRRTPGIWQPVWLETVSPHHLATLRWTPDTAAGALRVQATLNRPAASPLRLRVHLPLRGETLADDVYAFHDGTVDREIALAPHGQMLGREQLFWAPEHPNLIDAELTVLDGADELDTVVSYAGVRSVRTGNGRFFLNDRATYLRLVLEQGFWPESHLAAPSAEAIRREVELIKELGFNGARIHQKIEDPRFLYWCDRLGLFIWGEMPNAYRFSEQAALRLLREWTEAVQRDYSHPCIIVWVPLNESWGVPSLHGDAQQRHFLETLYHLTHTLDGTRPVITNDGWEHVKSDIWSIHDYALDGDRLEERYGSPDALDYTLRHVQPGPHPIFATQPQERDGEPVMVTEYGGISYRPKEGERWSGYGTVTSADEYETKYDELTGALLASPAIAGFCYTQLTDTDQETNGLLREDRTPKLDMARIRVITSRPAATLPREQTAAHRKRARETSKGNQTTASTPRNRD
jgi:beta-galactosidase/beta-glucuronidase